MIYKKLLSFVFVLMLAFAPLAPVYAAEDDKTFVRSQDCREDIENALSNVIGIKNDSKPYRDLGIVGYVQKLQHLLSTNIQTYSLLEQVQELARDARIEMNGICREVPRFDKISDYYIGIYSLDNCKNLTDVPTESYLANVGFCTTKMNDLLNAFLGELAGYLLKSAIEKASEPVVRRLRGLNSRLTALISEYGRLVSNFFTFNFRLGDAITKTKD